MTKKQTALVVKQVELSAAQIQTLAVPTPAAYIKTKPGRGNRPVRYVEGGYVISRLNAVFGPLNWSFTVLEQGETKRVNEKSAEGEVWVRGAITIHDHQRGLKVEKEQYGQHNVHVNIPIGDAYKAAATDALKKCASLIGIALDVMWTIGDDAKPDTRPTAPLQAAPAGAATGKKKEQSIYERALAFIAQTEDPSELTHALDRVNVAGGLTEAQREELRKAITKKLPRDEATGQLL